MQANEIKQNYSKEYVKSLNQKASFFISSNFDSATYFVSKAYAIAKTNHYSEEEAISLKLMGGISLYQGNYKQAMQFYIESLKIWDGLGDQKGIADSYNNIGNVYYYQLNLPKALEYYKKAAVIYRKLNNISGIAQSCYNVANILQDDSAEFKQAKYYMEQALVYFEKDSNERGMAYSLNGLGNIFDINKDYHNSIKKYEDALSFFLLLNDSRGVSSTLAALGTIYQKTGNTQRAIKYLNDGLILAHDIGSTDIVMQIYQALGELAYSKGNYKESTDYFKKYSSLKDSLVSISTIQQISELEVKYNLELKQQKIEKQNLELEKQNSEIKQQKIINISFVIGISFLFIILFVVLYYYRIKRKLTIKLEKQKNLIEEKNQELQVRNSEILKQRDEIEQNLEYTQKLQDVLKKDLTHYIQLSLRKIINPHFIYNSLNSIQGFIIQNNRTEAIQYLSDFADLMRKLLNQSQKEFIILKEEVETLQLYLKLESRRYEGKIEWEISIDEALDDENILIPPLLFQPFVENSIWHGIMPLERKGELTIRIEKSEESLICKIIDNGVGIEKSKELNKHRKKHESHGTRITEERINAINTLNDINPSISYTQIQNQDGSIDGTEVVFELPLIQSINDD